jgi:hypothetical protein
LEKLDDVGIDLESFARREASTEFPLEKLDDVGIILKALREERHQREAPNKYLET